MKNKQAVAALTALGHESRLNIFRLIVQRGAEGLTPAEIIELLGIHNATLSFHLKELVTAKLIKSVRCGRTNVYRPNTHFVAGLISFLAENCCGGIPCGMPGESNRDLVVTAKKTGRCN